MNTIYIDIPKNAFELRQKIQKYNNKIEDLLEYAKFGLPIDQEKLNRYQYILDVLTGKIVQPKRVFKNQMENSLKKLAILKAKLELLKQNIEINYHS